MVSGLTPVLCVLRLTTYGGEEGAPFQGSDPIHEARGHVRGGVRGRHALHVQLVRRRVRV